MVLILLPTKTIFAYSRKPASSTQNQVQVSAVVLEHITYYYDENGQFSTVTNHPKGSLVSTFLPKAGENDKTKILDKESFPYFKLTVINF